MTRPSKTRRFSRSRRNGRPFEFRAREIPFCPPLVRTASISVRGRLLQRRPAGGKLRSEIAEVPAKVSLPFSPPAVGASALERERAEKGAAGRFCKVVFTYGQEQIEHSKTDYLRLRGGDGEQRVRRRGRNVGGAPPRTDGHFFPKSPCHRHPRHPSRFHSDFYLIRDTRNLRFFRIHSHGARRYRGRLLGAKLLGKLPRKTVAIVFAVLQALAGAWMFGFV